MRDQVLDRKDSISVINFLTEFKRARNHFRIREGALIRLFQELKNGLAYGGFKSWLTLSWNNADVHECTMKSYAEVVDNLLRRYFIDTIIAKADEAFLNTNKAY